MSEVASPFTMSSVEALAWAKKPMKAFINILGLTLERRLRRVAIRGMPFVLYYEPTTFCNLQCPSCPTGTGELDRPKDKVRLEQFQTTVNALADWVFTLYMYNWGEPLLHKDFAKLVKHAVDKGIVVRTSSNFSIPLSQEKCEEIVKSGLQFLIIGIDGASPEVHAMYRKGSNLKTVHENIRNLVLAKEKLGSPTPMIHGRFLALAHNEAEIEEFQKQMSELGVDSFDVAPAWLPSDGTVSRPKDSRYDIYKVVNKSISRLRLQGRGIRPCTWLYYATVINPGGTISPCCGIVSEKADLGKLLPTDDPVEIGSQFRAVWNGPKYTASRKLFSDGTRVERWASKNLRDLQPENMAFSNQKGGSLICTRCPIPHALEQWSTGAVVHLYRLFIHETKRCIESLDFKDAAINAIKALILRIAVQLQ